MLADITNADRAHWAFLALKDFVKQTRVDDADDAIGDLICNLLHLARGRGLDPARVSARALGMMEDEVAEDDEGDMENVQRLFAELLPG